MLRIPDLERQFDLARERQAGLSDYTNEDLFPAWVLLALASTDEQAVVEAITGGKHDADIDALFIEDSVIWIVQGKLRQFPGKSLELTEDVRRFASRAERLFEDASKSSDPMFWKAIAQNRRALLERFNKAARLARSGARSIRMIYASTGRFPRNLERELKRSLTRLPVKTSLDLLDSVQVGRLLANYIRDVAPAVPQLTLPVVAGELRSMPMGDRQLKSWTVATTAQSIAELHRLGGEQIFARNIRFGLGDKVHANEAIAETLKVRPERFWYLNNGLTIACDSADTHGESIVMRGAQIINGQQTTRTIAKVLKSGTLRQRTRDAHVAVRVISVEGAPSEDADALIAQVVEATNLQNAISKADLRSNDVRQIELARALGSRGYRYVRKKGTQDAIVDLGLRKRPVKRDELFAAAAGACFESVALREGQAPLFDPDEPYYSKVLSLSVERILLALLVWRAVRKESKRNATSQAAKFIVHYYVHRELVAAATGRTSQVVAALERKKADVIMPLRRAIASLFAVAARSWKENRRQEGKTLLPKAYFQREVSSSHFARMWRGRRAAVSRRAVRTSLDSIVRALDD